MNSFDTTATIGTPNIITGDVDEIKNDQIFVSKSEDSENLTISSYIQLEQENNGKKSLVENGKRYKIISVDELINQYLITVDVLPKNEFNVISWIYDNNPENSSVYSISKMPSEDELVIRTRRQKFRLYTLFGILIIILFFIMKEYIYDYVLIKRGGLNHLTLCENIPSGCF
tara:strand:- start:762 stop:1277 length:516 start_codon:yes stop_codon:yes gene_type:complete